MSKKFICDGMLGRLCKLLRICGIDTLYSNRGKAILVEARKEGRVILTMNTRLRGKEGVCFIEHTAPQSQLGRVITEYKLQKDIQLFSRCIECNAPLVPTPKDAVKDRVPYYTYKHFDDFATCPNCQRVYWKGSHYKKMLEDVLPLISQWVNITI
jgi:uncharacterized protein with PIN domain